MGKLIKLNKINPRQPDTNGLHYALGVAHGTLNKLLTQVPQEEWHEHISALNLYLTLFVNRMYCKN